MKSGADKIINNLFWILIICHPQADQPWLKFRYCLGFRNSDLEFHCLQAKKLKS